MVSFGEIGVSDSMFWNDAFIAHFGDKGMGKEERADTILGFDVKFPTLHDFLSLVSNFLTSLFNSVKKKYIYIIIYLFIYNKIIMLCLSLSDYIAMTFFGQKQS